MKSDYEARKANRIARYKELAEKNELKAKQQSEAATKMASVIPFGQPILIGHHSESRDRNYRKKIGKLYEKSWESQKKAGYYAHKVDVVTSDDAIRSDDPQAIEKLKDKLGDMQRMQEFMKATNKLIKNKKLTDEEKISMLAQYQVDKEFANKLIKGGFERFQLSNNSQNMARVRKRIAILEKQSQLVSKEETINGIRIFINTEANRIQLFFPGKPAEEVRHQLKSHGFRWSPREGAWQRHISNMAAYYAQRIAKQAGAATADGIDSNQ